MLYGMETAFTKRQEAEMETAELRMLSLAMGVMRLDRTRNEYIRGTAKVVSMGVKLRESRLRRYGHMI